MEMMFDRLTKPSELAASGEWETDNAAGRELAGAWIERIQCSDNPPMFVGLLRDALGSGRWTGVEAGFWNTFGVALVGA